MKDSIEQFVSDNILYAKILMILLCVFFGFTLGDHLGYTQGYRNGKIVGFLDGDAAGLEEGILQGTESCLKELFSEEQSDFSYEETL